MRILLIYFVLVTFFSRLFKNEKDEKLKVITTPIQKQTQNKIHTRCYV